MNPTKESSGEDSKNDLLNFVRGLSKEQAENIMCYLPQLTALLEEPMLPYLQEPSLQTG